MSVVIAHSLGKRGIEVIGCDDVEMTVLSFSRYVKRSFVHAPFDADPEAFVDDLVAKVRKFRPDTDIPYVLLPVFRETEVIAKYRHRFEPYITVAAPSYDAMRRVHPKDELFSTAVELGIEIPRTWNPRTVEELDAAIPEMTFPVLIKPPDDTGGRGIVSCASPAELRARLRRYHAERSTDALIQEFAPGDDYCLTVLFEHGTLKASMAYRNLRRFPAESGAGIFRETVDDAQFLDVARRLLGPLEWNGIAELDFRWDGRPGSQARLLEVNPRFWAGLFQSVDSGIDFPWMLYQLAVTGSAPPSTGSRIGHRTKVPGLWLVSAVRDVTGSDNRFERLRHAWQEARTRIKDNDIRDGFADLARSMERRTTLRQTIATLRAIIQDGRKAKNDLFYRDDPFIVLGVMFVLASLIRHRRLPPEIRSR
ncbi:MAG: biotin carboxylase [Spirochaetaceae bacterium]|nr:MAG: biotin carboxylase [Spirochaetaceae bacterium]